MKILNIGMVVIAFFVAGCSENKAYTPPFIRPHAIVTASYEGSSSKTPVVGNYSHGKDGKPDRYEGGAGLGNGKVELRYEYVGRAFVPVDELGKGFDYEDVYVFRFRMTPEGRWQVIPFVFKGGSVVVYDRDGLVIRMNET